MVINSIAFLLFFILSTVILLILPAKVRLIGLTIINCFFIASFGIGSLIVILSITVLGYLFGFVAEKKSKPLLLVISAVLVIPLVFFKYEGNNFLIPVGISFYVLQIIGYLVDIYRGKIGVEKNILVFFAYTTFFPKLVSGPIISAEDVLPQFRNIDKMKLWNFDRVVHGIWMIIWGSFLKLVIADRAALLVGTVLGQYEGYGFVEIAIACFLYAIQIYCDFEGYTGIARGTALILGISISANFRQPYLAGSIKDFWRRWHISLTNWLTEYVYISFGGNRKGLIRKYLNIIIVFFVSGLWHGPGTKFIVWGLLHAIYQICEDLTRRFINKKPMDNAKVSLVARIRTFILVDFAWLFFAADSLRDALGIIRQCFTTIKTTSIYNLGLATWDILIIVVSLVCVLAVDIVCEKGISLYRFFEEKNFLIKIVPCLLALIVTMLLGVYGSDYPVGNFIYAQF